MPPAGVRRGPRPCPPPRPRPQPPFGPCRVGRASRFAGALRDSARPTPIRDSRPRLLLAGDPADEGSLVDLLARCGRYAPDFPVAEASPGRAFDAWTAAPPSAAIRQHSGRPREDHGAAKMRTGSPRRRAAPGRAEGVRNGCSESGSVPSGFVRRRGLVAGCGQAALVVGDDQQVLELVEVEPQARGTPSARPRSGRAGVDDLADQQALRVRRSNPVRQLDAGGHHLVADPQAPRRVDVAHHEHAAQLTDDLAGSPVRCVLPDDRRLVSVISRIRAKFGPTSMTRPASAPPAAMTTSPTAMPRSVPWSIVTTRRNCRRLARR